ncbi:hypothetical protein ACOSQ4_016456 [Xanthoceras sorbifolium]
MPNVVCLSSSEEDNNNGVYFLTSSEDDDYLPESDSESNTESYKFIGQAALTMLENLRRSFLKSFHERHEEAKKWMTETPPGVWSKLTENQDAGRYMQVMCASEEEYEVKEWNKYYIVRLDLKSCDCMSWKISEIPYKHVMTIISATRRQGHECFLTYLFKEAYLRIHSNVIHPIPH